jgi:hypothetical protein
LALERAGHPIVRMSVNDAYDLGAQVFLWELAVALAGWRLGINPFDQPNVESAKEMARRMVAEYVASGRLPTADPDATGRRRPLDGQPPGGDPLVAPAHFLDQARPGDYIALQAYLTPTPETEAALQQLRIRLRDRYRLATTVGYGPRFLHSTGQLHKGDAGNGLFIQFTTDHAEDVPIPDEVGRPGSSITFGVLQLAQALGDGQALQAADRRILRLHLEEPAAHVLPRLIL